MKTFTVVALTFLICMIVFCTKEGRPQLRCQCIRTYSGNPISIKRVDSIKIFPAGPHCNNEEIIATMKKKHSTTCLNPSDAWVKSLIEEWNTKTNTIKAARIEKHLAY
ncbi:C-X-C motif chemokine 10-like [Triplophysa dalaica]|uniref:C-X-C motif chemokine 10-like n=1 Tax=Triplophysa dalaica TaxID=1582913 RepID=UPI0024DF728B|nr:C-X-C motif chemokine 10-like [Triplophysa dalaica]